MIDLINLKMFSICYKFTFLQLQRKKKRKLKKRQKIIKRRQKLQKRGD